jgi:hypothetical protein
MGRLRVFTLRNKQGQMKCHGTDEEIAVSPQAASWLKSKRGANNSWLKGIPLQKRRRIFVTLLFARGKTRTRLNHGRRKPKPNISIYTIRQNMDVKLLQCSHSAILSVVPSAVLSSLMHNGTHLV